MSVALHFERVIHFDIERVIWWNQKKGRPYSRGGIVRYDQEHSLNLERGHVALLNEEKERRC